MQSQNKTIFPKNTYFNEQNPYKNNNFDFIVQTINFSIHDQNVKTYHKLTYSIYTSSK